MLQVLILLSMLLTFGRASVAVQSPQSAQNGSGGKKIAANNHERADTDPKRTEGEGENNRAGEAPTTAKGEPKSGVEKVAALVGAVRSIIIDAFVVVFLSILFATIYWEIKRNTVLIDPIDVPEEVSARGYTPEVAARRIASELTALRTQARVTRRLEEWLEMSTAQVDFAVPSAGISYRSLVRYARQILALPQPRLTGEIVREEQEFRLLLRAGDGRESMKLLQATEKNLSHLFQEGAFEAASLVDPDLISTYWFWAEQGERRFDKTMNAVRTCLTKTNIKNHHRAYVTWGNVLTQQRRFDEAERKYRWAAQLAPRHAPTFNSWGSLLRTKRRLDQAESMFRQAIDIDRKYVAGWGNLGSVFNDKKRHEDAAEYFRKALQLDPRSAPGWNGLSFSLWRTGKSDEAERGFGRAIDLDPKFPWSYINWARLKFSQHQHDQAIEHLEAFAAEKTAFAPALAVWGDILSSRKQFDEARKKYHSAITADPRAANGYVGMAILNRRRGRFRRALGWSRKALKIDPYFVAALSSEAESLRALGKLDEATEAYARVLELDPYQASAHVGLGHLERLRHRLHEAVSQFERATIIDGTEGWAWRSWGDVLVEMHHYEDAIEKYQSALELDPGDGAALASLGSVWVTLGRIKEGLEILRSACVVDGLNDVTWSREVTALVSLDLTEEALRQIQNANALFPSDPRLHVDWGRVLHDMGRSAQAIAKFEEAVEIDPYFAIAHNWLAIEQGRLKHRVEARQSFRNALALQPRNDWIRRSIGQWLRNDKKFKLAMRWYRWSYRQVPESAKLLMEWSITSRMIAESPETGEGQRAALMHSAEELIDQAIRLDIWDTSLVIAKSDLLVASDRHTEAVKGLERAHALDPYDPVVLIRYGEILIKLKRPSEAAKAYHGALQLRPNNEKWRKKLESLS